MSSQDNLQNKLRAGVEAARRGDRVTARRLLEEVIEVDENNEMAWIWLASSVTTVSERRTCLERVLQINPNNTRAREALDRLTQEAVPVAPRTAGINTDEARLRQQISQVRRVQEQNTNPVDRDEPGGFPLTTFIILGLLLVVVFGFGAVLLNILNQNANPPAPATLVVLAATDTEVPTETIEPTITPTTQGLSADQVTRQFAPTLPPLFTPTFTPSATATLLPSPTPLGLENYPMLYMSLNSGVSEPDAYTLNADGSNEGLLIDLARDVAYDATGERIVFIRDVDVDGVIAPEVFIAQADGEDSGTQLTSLRSADTAHPSFSLDGSRIVFSSTNVGSSEELWLMNADGTNLRQLTNNPFVDREPSFSPVDNNVILFTSDRDSPDLMEIYTMTLPEAGEPQVRRLTNASGSNYSPSWSQDGRWIVFVSDRSGSGDIYLIGSEGGPGTLVTVGDGNVENRRPAISGNGRLVAYISNRESENFQTYLVDVSTNQVTRLTDNGREDMSVIFAPVPVEILVAP